MPRAIGQLEVSTKVVNGRSAIDGLRQSGALRALFPRSDNRDDLESTIINTSGGITSGDRLAVSGHAGRNSALTLTTQAAERAYRAGATLPGRLHTTLRVDAGATLHWLPQELILFDGAHFERKLAVDLHNTASFLMVEPIVFGRATMGERLKTGRFSDQVIVRRDGRPIYIDGIRLEGAISDQLASPTLAKGAGAMASVLFVAPDAERYLTPTRKLLDDAGGASLLADDVLSLRCLAYDSFVLRQTLIPALQMLRGTDLPLCWRL